MTGASTAKVAGHRARAGYEAVYGRFYLSGFFVS